MVWQHADMRIVAPPGVFKPISDSWMLAEAAAGHAGPGKRLLDLCTGSGAIAIAGAQAGAEATAVDVSRRAVFAARLNARLNGVRVRGVRGSLFDAVPGERFDCIVSNPPYVPSTRQDLPRTGASRAWEAGRDGRVLLDRICAGAAEHLNPGGVVLLVHSDLIGEQRTLELLDASGLQAETIRREPGPLGPLMRERVRQGVVDAPGGAEEVLILRGRLTASVSTPEQRASAVA